MGAYEGSKMQEEDERRKKFTSDEAIKMAVDTVKGMGISKHHEDELRKAFNDGYNQAIIDVKAAISKVNSPI